MAPFVDVNTRLKNAINKFEEYFCILIINSAFGKTMDSKLEREKLAILKNKREKFSSKNSSERNEELPNHWRSVSQYPFFSLKNIMIVYAIILDIAKRFMFQIKYRKKKPTLT